MLRLEDDAPPKATIEEQVHVLQLRVESRSTLALQVIGFDCLLYQE